ncbi:MAG TPA: hypothetical protein VK613_10160 [Gaiellaceae bacterium]|nr:hypothetical protein [Gaiellaceae bacterium]
MQRQAEELGIDQPEIQVTDSIHAGRKRRGRCTPARFPRAVFAFPQNAARAAF